MRELLIEFIGTFFLVLIVALTGNPLAIGAILIAMVYMGGYISGAHYNPAVTLAVWMNKGIKTELALKYVGVQLLAGILASAVYFLVTKSYFIPSPATTTSPWVALLCEILFTFVLATVVLHVAASKESQGHDFYGLAIGLTVMAGAFAVGAISGGAFNPAVGIAPQLFDLGHLGSHISNILLYLIGPLGGGALAALVYKQR